MSYRLKTGEAPSEGIPRIALEQIDQALEQLTRSDDRNEGVHDARKRFKKVRAVLRLVRDEIGEEVYQTENVRFRDMGRRLAEVRDRYVHIETLDALKERFDEQLADDAFQDLRAVLERRHQEAMERLLDDENRMGMVAVELDAVRSRPLVWPIGSEGFDAFRDGLKRVYKRGRKAMAAAYADPSAEAFHEWRKRVKYLWYHMRILRPIWREMQEPLAELLHDLADYLGDDHDLAELGKTLGEDPDIQDDEEDVKLVEALIGQRHRELVAAARPLGARIYVEKPSVFVDRMEGYWTIAWRPKEMVEEL